MRANERLRVLTTVMRSFAEATTDLGQLLHVIARNVAEVLGDACVLLMLSERGDMLAPIAAHAVDAEALARAQALVESDPFTLETHPTARQVLESKGSFLVPKIDPTALQMQTTSAYAAYQREQGIHSLLAVSLHAHGKSLGLMTLTRYRPTSPPYDEEDRELALNLADHASLAIANARLYEAERSAMRSKVAAEATLERVRALVEALPDAVVVTNAQRHIETVNTQTERCLGYTREELGGASLDLVLVAPDRARRKDGHEFYVELTEAPLLTAEGPLVVTAIRDVTERKRNEQVIVEAKEAVERANRELEAFSYSVAHDLRTPLRGMNGFARILLEDHAGQLDAEGRALLETIATNAKKMGHLIDGLLDLARLNRAPLTRDKLDLSAMVREALADAARPGTEIVVPDGIIVDADRALLEPLVQNLVGNAVKFTARVEHPRIELGRMTLEGEEVYFLRDNGAGFDMKFADLLFQPFQRLHNEKDFSGTGIGLATVQRIVVRHGGRLWAEGAVNEGATMFFTLPKA